MNIRYTICLLTAIGLVACSGNDDVWNGDGPEEQELTMEQMVSDVPIIFAPVEMAEIQWGVEAVETRGGSISATDFTTPDKVGVFCLAKRKISDDAKNIAWNRPYTSETTNKLLLWSFNEEATINGIGDNKGQITWSEQQQMHYYPSTGWYAYGFAAYHPLVDRKFIVSDGTTKSAFLKAYIKVDGNDDVIHAVAAEPEHQFGDDEINRLAFSRSYYDKIRTDGQGWESTFPKFEFQHLMSRLDFYFCLNGTPLENIHVDKVEFDNFWCIMEVPLVSLDKTTDVMSNPITSASTPYVLNDNDNQLGKITLDDGTLLKDQDGYASCFGHFELYEKGETLISGQKNNDGSYKYNLTREMQKVGDCILIPPVQSGTSKKDLQLYVTLCDDNGHKYRNSKAIKVPRPDPRWEIGKRYDVRITLNSPVGIVLAPELDNPAPRHSASSTDGEVTLWQPDAKVTITPRE